MRFLYAVVAASLMAACNKADDEPLRRADGSLLSSSGGEVALADGSNLKFVITSERYKQWEAARAGLRKNVAARYGTLLKPKSPTEKTIERAISFLETDVDAREAIERSGMSVRDFVLMTVALEQEMRVANGQGMSRPRPTTLSEPIPAPAPQVDSPIATIPVQPLPAPEVRVDSAPRPPRDTASPRSDTLSPLPKPPRDTVKDTTSALFPDSLRRA